MDYRTRPPTLAILRTREPRATPTMCPGVIRCYPARRVRNGLTLLVSPLRQALLLTVEAMPAATCCAAIFTGTSTPRFTRTSASPNKQEGKYDLRALTCSTSTRSDSPTRLSIHPHSES